MNNLTVDQLKEFLQIQKEFDSRIPTLNLQDSKIAYVVEFFEWFNTLETFKNWKKKPGKPLDVQLDELADMLAFGLSIANQQEVTNEKLEYGLSTLRKDGYLYNESQSVWDFMSDVSNVGLEPLSAVIIPLDIAYNLYSIDQLIDAYKKKMKRNHERQDGTADAGKGYV
ncbi:dUTPase [Staphylococcus aureus]|uniref:dUTPase n=9 Tax=root TaxID=1 RepID=G4KNT7_9CAUD|nr:dUTPase [Staphylococcus aureus]YP_007237149.1 dUTPase [Staphylococcus phage phi5967PVL]YP_009829484.1 dUTPase [Staphylococcus phage phi7247PVL]AUM57912.1 dUTPase [Staphylococcus phage phiSa2wa_st59]UWJ04633.1 dimeric dUTPase [Staphylococcus phage PHB22a]UWJ04666.1 dimeric dUTPase [Staphylococcus phage PHB40a]WGL32221.1 dimeric dUTPase [Staphylococcus phage phiST9-A]WGL32293.1 dimeric dUTPase [Staphylococcus phage phiST9-B]